VCDGLVISGTTAVFIESKGGFIRGDAKYGGDPAVLKAEIDKKYVDPNGVFQIARSIAKALRQPNRPLIRDVDLSGIRTVIPLLVTRDDVGDGFFVNSYLNSRFDEIRQTSNLNREIAPVHCTKLISVSVDIAEKLSPYLVDTRIGEILAGRLMADPLLLTPFFIKPPPCIVSKGDRPPTLLRSLQPELSRLAAKFLEVSSPESE